MKGLALALAAAVVAIGIAYPEIWLAGHDATGDVIQIEGLSGPVIIQRDSAGFPLIRAENELDAFVGLGFAMAADRAFQIESRVRSATHRLSPLRHALATIDPELEARLEAFAAGGNAYLSQAGTHPSPEHRLLRQAARTWRAGDTLLVLHALLAAPLSEAAPCPSGSWMGCGGYGSFAVDAAHTASRAPILSAAVTGTITELPSFWYAAQLSTPEGYLQALFLPGVPLAITGRNASGAWTTESWLSKTGTTPDVAVWASAMLELERASTPRARAATLEGFAASGLGTSIVTADASGARRLLFDVDRNRTLVTSAARSGVLPVARGRYGKRLARGLESRGIVTTTDLGRLAGDLSHGGAELSESDIVAAFPEGDPDTEHIRSLLTSWDGLCQRESRGCALFEPAFSRWRESARTTPATTPTVAALRRTTLDSLEQLEQHSGSDPDGWNLGSNQRLELHSPASRVPILGRWFRRGPVAFEGCSSCAAAAWAPPGEGIERQVTVGTNARFEVDLSNPGTSRIALPTAATENPFRASGQPITDAWLAGHLHTLSIDPRALPEQDPVRLVPSQF